MRDPWIREHFGPEVNARAGFERELGDDLATAWRAAATPASAAPTGAAAEVSSDALWAITAPEPPTGPAPAATHRPQQVPLQRRPVGTSPAPTGAHRGGGTAVVRAEAAAAVAFVVIQFICMVAALLGIIRLSLYEPAMVFRA